jgi:hypothetical protein
VCAGDIGLEGVEAWVRTGADTRGDLQGGRDELLAYGGVEGIVKFIMAVGGAGGAGVIDDDGGGGAGGGGGGVGGGGTGTA